MHPRYRLHVHPALRLLRRVLIPNWLAITLGRHVWAWRPLTDPELAHELAHVAQWRRYGLAFPFLYALASLRARRAGRRWYEENRFEIEARQEADRRR
jgi:hypothetical protein